MDFQFTPVWIYLFICRRSGRIEALAQRQSNNSDPDFTDEEVLNPNNRSASTSSV